MWNTSIIFVCVWGMGMPQVVFNIEAGNYYMYSKSTFIMTLIKQEKLVFI